jgi:hypothetical protein
VGLLYKCPFMATIREMRQGFRKGRRPKQSRLKNSMLYARPDDKTIDPAKEAEQRETLSQLTAEQEAEITGESNQSKAYKKKQEETKQGNTDAGY